MRNGLQSGLAVLIVLAAAFPVRVRYSLLGIGSFTIFDLIVFASAPVLLGLLFWRGKVQVGDRRTFLLLLLPTLAHVLSLLWSQDRGATVYKSCFSVEAVLAYLMGVNLCARMPPSRIMAYLGGFVVLLIAGAVLSMLHVPGFEPPTYGLEEGSEQYVSFLVSYYTRFSHPFIGLSNDFASVLAFFVLIFLAYAIASRRRLYYFLAVLTMAAIMLTLSRGVLLALVFSLIVFLALARQHVTVRLPGVVGALVLIAAIGYGFYQVSDLTQQGLAGRLSANNVEDRGGKLQVAMKKITAAPVLGYGGGVTPDKSDDLQGGAHNTYVQQVLYFGLPLGIVISLGIVALPLRFLFWASPRPRVRLLAVGIGASLLAESVIFISETSFEATLLRVLFYFSLGLSLDVLRSLEREAGAEAVTQPLLPRMVLVHG